MSEIIHLVANGTCTYECIPNVAKVLTLISQKYFTFIRVTVLGDYLFIIHFHMLFLQSVEIIHVTNVVALLRQPGTTVLSCSLCS